MKIIVVFFGIVTSLTMSAANLGYTLGFFDKTLYVLKQKLSVEKIFPKIEYPPYATLSETAINQIKFGKIITDYKKLTTENLENSIQSKLDAFKMPTVTEIKTDTELAQLKNKELDEIRKMLFAYHYRPQPDTKKFKAKDAQKESAYEKAYMQKLDQLEQLVKQKTSVDEQVASLAAEIEAQKKSLQTAITSSKAIAKATPAQIKNLEKLLADYQAIAKKFKDKYKKSIEDDTVVSEAKKVIKQLKSSQYSKQDLDATKKMMQEADKVFKSKINQLKTTKNLSVYILDKFTDETMKYKQALDAYEKMHNEPYPAGPKTLEDINSWILQKRLDLRREIIQTPKEEEEEEEDIEAAQQELAQLTKQVESPSQKPSQVIKSEKQLGDLLGQQLSKVKLLEEDEEAKLKKELAKLSPAERKRREAELEKQRKQEEAEWA